MSGFDSTLLSRSEIVRPPSDRDHVESGVIERARAEAEGIFERRQGARPAAELDEYAPGRGRDMRPHHAAPAQGEQRAQHHKQCKRRVQRDDEVGRDRLT